MNTNPVPEKFYGVSMRQQNVTPLDDVIEQVTNLGYAVLDGGYTPDQLGTISQAFDATWTRYIAKYGEDVLRSTNEYNTIRAVLTHGAEEFFQLAFNENLMTVLKKLIHGKFILNQQNGIVNPAQQSYNQGFWHRDIPYQHYISSRPMAFNALFCVDDFTLQNGSTWVLPASHLKEPYPTQQYLERNAVQVEAKAGSFLLLDCMIYHTGGYNQTTKIRRAVNHVFTIPMFKQQINIPNNMPARELTTEQREILGFPYVEVPSIDAYIESRKGKV